MTKIEVTTPSKHYPVFIGGQALSRLEEVLRSLFPKPKNILVITDENVGDLYAPFIEERIDELFECRTFTIKAGDDQKSFQNYYQCHTFALEMGLDRSSVILALGGGMVGDIAGFVAGTYMRGIRFIQIPTTILAHDSAVGGKTGINHPEGKNMIGVFHQPEAVIYHTPFLKSLPEKEVRSGFAEIIKHGLIADAHFYEWLFTNVKSIADLTDNLLLKALTRGIEIKNEVVTKDEKENGVRAILNFGHTLGHAVEAELNFNGITHGEAVAHGMVFALFLNENTIRDGTKLLSWLVELGYPKLPAGLSSSSLINRMKKDKKASEGLINMVLLKRIGEPYITSFTASEIEERLTDFLATSI